MKSIVAVSILVAFSLSAQAERHCSNFKGNDNETQKPIADAADFLTSNPDMFGLNSTGEAHAIALENKVVRGGSNALRFEIRPGDTWRRGSEIVPGSHRVEVYERCSAIIGEEYWYEFSLQIPSSVQTRDERLVIGQWHDQADEGEPSRNPSLVQRFRDGRFFIQIRWNEIPLQTGPDAKDDSKKKTVFEDYDFPRDKWVDFVYHVKWSYLSDGRLEVFRRIEGGGLVKIVDYQGPIGYNDVHGTFFKFGLYRDDWSSTDSIYWDNYQRTQDPRTLKLL